MFNDDDKDFDISGEASRSTMGTAASWLGWFALLALIIVTGVHAVSVTMFYTGLNANAGNMFSAIRIFGVVLAEVFAAVTTVLLATHVLRAKQKPAAIVLELTWAVFATLNLISSFAVEHGGDIPSFVSTWVRYGLPIAALIMGIEFYIILRLNPDAKRADDEAELRERFAAVRHRAKLEVMSSPQMRAVIRQMSWQTLPTIVGRQMNLTDEQIRALTSQAPKLLDLNNDGVPDIQEPDGGEDDPTEMVADTVGETKEASGRPTVRGRSKG